ncbi:cobalamin biosynthesis protein CobW [Pleurocapsa sp. CCALA 161]|uniref:CobW family GTP-binding protein n=1 Tax=Pleurocapsa sp. CCALA 161 TaxID=2107688 RepID=UPI000D048578|nr:GTP-binding protein [Pleurocapsa sp. CCALA 161]PSB05512.1 cobalamin biosynthesis protein CobW [Pleurocapsa sp. CCALA 161]PSB09069.1 cobalamin biosynthesis protein CobW [Pleurocapsa sp. CCALA 161]
MLEISPSELPVTIITGFLGSGKTTLLNQILQNTHNLKVAVLVNEFGDINIDSQLLISYEDDMVELSNGCICCTINEGLVKAVQRILAKEEKVDRLIIETTGVADPLPIILTFVGSDFRDFTRLDSVITVVDAETFTPEHFESEAAFKQITFADILLLNKTDLVDEGQLRGLETYIASIKKSPRIIYTNYAQVPLPLILDVGLTKSKQARSFQDGVPSTPIASYVEKKEQEHHQHHDHHHSPHLEADGFVSMSFQSDKPFDVYKFQKFLTDQLPVEVFRAKGIIWFAGSELRHVFQLCGQRSDLKSDRWSTPPVNQLVFIGRHLDTDKLRQQLNDCLATSVTSVTSVTV